MDNIKDNRRDLAEAVVAGMDFDDMYDTLVDVLMEDYQQDDELFQSAWKTIMGVE